MNKYFKYLFIVILWSCSSKDINEIDRLVEKYNSSVIHLTYGEQDLQGNKYVFYNTDKKPFKIVCAGDTKDWELLANIITMLIHEKMEVGFTPTKQYATNFSLNDNRERISDIHYQFSKDNYLFEVVAEGMEDRITKEPFISYSFINIDKSRIFGDSAKIGF